MKCFDCARNGTTSETIGICRHCSSGVCDVHGTLVSDPVTVPTLVMGTRVLPKRARLLFCHHCLAALRQRGVLEVKEDWKLDGAAPGSAVAENAKYS
jgi:hypothetical protein